MGFYFLLIITFFFSFTFKKVKQHYSKPIYMISIVNHWREPVLFIIIHVKTHKCALCFRIIIQTWIDGFLNLLPDCAMLLVRQYMNFLNLYTLNYIYTCSVSDHPDVWQWALRRRDLEFLGWNIFSIKWAQSFLPALIFAISI